MKMRRPRLAHSILCAALMLLLVSPALAKKAFQVGGAKPAPAGSTTVKNVPADAADPIKQYFEGFRKQDWKAIAAIMHKDALKELRQALVNAAEADKSGQKLQQLLGKKATLAELRKQTPAKTFVELMSSLAAQGGPGLAAVASGTQTAVLGAVPEDSRLHVVLRQRVTFKGKTEERVAVLTFQLEGKQWRAMLSNDMQMFVGQLKLQSGT